ncbi:MAG: hypothetical protein AAGA55_10580 [Planctomycetota bacterium]
MNTQTLATAFIDAIPMHDTWYLLIVPMVVFIAIGYKAVRCRDMGNYWRQVLVFIIQVLGGMALLTVAFMVTINVLVPLLAPLPA